MKEQYELFKEEIKKYITVKDNMDTLNEVITDLIVRKQDTEDRLRTKNEVLAEKQGRFKLYFGCSVVSYLCVILYIIAGNIPFMVLQSVLSVFLSCNTFMIKEDISLMKWENKGLKEEIGKIDTCLDPLQKELAKYVCKYPDIDKSIKDVQSKLSKIISSMKQDTVDSNIDKTEEELIDKPRVRIRKVDIR